ncbi:MAG: oligosaccharide flippase family protein [Spirosomataceae bacterium]
MGIIIRQSLKNSVVSYAGVAIGTINVLFLYNQFLSQEQLGFYATLTSMPLVFASFAQLGMPHVTVRFFNQFADPERQHNGFFTFLLAVPLLGFGAFSLLYWVGKGLFFQVYGLNSPLLTTYYWYFLLFTGLVMYQTVLESYARVHLRIVVPAIVRELFLKLSNSALALLYGFKVINFNQLIMWLLVVYVVAVFLLFCYIAWLGRLYWKVDFSFVRKPIFGEMMQYGAWVLLGGASATLVPHIEKMMLPAYPDGMDNTAVFDIASKIALVIAIPRNAIAQISSPLLAESLKKDNLEHIDEIYKKSSLNLLIIGAFLFLGIWCNIDSIFQLIPKSEIYSAGKWVVLFFGLGKLVDMATGLNSEIIMNSRYYRWDLFFYLFLTVLLLFSNAILIPMYSYNGAAFASLVSLVCYNAVKYFFILQKFKLSPFTISTAKVIGLFAVTFLVVNLIPTIGSNLIGTLLTILVKSIVILLIFGGGVLWSGVSEDGNRTLKGIYLRLLKRI